MYCFGMDLCEGSLRMIVSATVRLQNGTLLDGLDFLCQLDGLSPGLRLVPMCRCVLATWHGFASCVFAATPRHVCAYSARYANALRV